MADAALYTALETARAKHEAITVYSGGVEITFVPSEIDDEDETVLGKTVDGRLVEFQFNEISLKK